MIAEQVGDDPRGDCDRHDDPQVAWKGSHGHWVTIAITSAAGPQLVPARKNRQPQDHEKQRIPISRPSRSGAHDAEGSQQQGYRSHVQPEQPGEGESQRQRWWAIG